MKTYLDFKKTLLGIAALVLIVTLTACGATEQYKRDIDKQVGQSSDIIKKRAVATSPQKLQEQNPLIIKMNNIVWLGDNVVDTQKKRLLPNVFKKNVTFIFPDKANLSTIAERITQVTGVLVRIMPDVFITADALNATTNSTLADTTATNTDTSAIPAGMGTTDATVTTNGYDLHMKLNYTGRLDGLLDIIAARVGISWQFKNNSIYLYRLVTKTFTLKALPGNVNLTTKIGKDSSTTSGTNNASGGTSTASAVNNDSRGTYSSSSSSGTDIKLSIWDNIEKAIHVMMTPLGQVAVSQSTGTITVRDTQEVIDEITKLINKENRIATRQVNFKIEVYSVTTSSGNQFGVDWNAVYQSLSNQVNNSYKFTFDSPTSLVNNQAAQLGYEILTSGSAANRWETSSLLFKALSDAGKASVVTSTSITTTNNQPIPFALTDQTGYLASTEAATATIGGTSGGTPGLTPGMVTTGFVMNILPTILDNSRVLLQLSIGISDLQGLKVISSGNQSIQTPEISSNEIFQRISLKNNQTLVLNAFSRVSGQYNKRGITKDIDTGLGGSFDGSQKRTTIVVVITPTLLEGS